MMASEGNLARVMAAQDRLRSAVDRTSQAAQRLERYFDNAAEAGMRLGQMTVRPMIAVRDYFSFTVDRLMLQLADLNRIKVEVKLVMNDKIIETAKQLRQLLQGLGGTLNVSVKSAAGQSAAAPPPIEVKSPIDTWIDRLQKVAGILKDFGASFASIGDGFKTIGDGIKSIGDGLKGIGDGFKSIGDGIKNVGDGIKSIGDGFKGIGDGIKSVGDGFKGIGDGIKSIGDGIKGVGDGIMSIGDGFKGIGDGIMSIGDGIKGIGDGIKSVGDGFKAVGDGIKSIGDGFKGLGDGLKSFGEGLKSVGKGIGDGFKSIGDGLKGFAQSFKGFIAEVKGIMDSIKDLINSFNGKRGKSSSGASENSGIAKKAAGSGVSPNIMSTDVSAGGNSGGTSAKNAGQKPGGKPKKGGGRLKGLFNYGSRALEAVTGESDIVSAPTDVITGGSPADAASSETSAVGSSIKGGKLKSLLKIGSKAIKSVGKVFKPLDIGLSALDVATSDNKPKAAVQAGANMAGSALGAVIGSAVLPGLGTVAGGMIGGWLGDKVGGFLGDKFFGDKPSPAQKITDTSLVPSERDAAAAASANGTLTAVSASNDVSSSQNYNVAVDGVNVNFPKEKVDYNELAHIVGQQLVSQLQTRMPNQA